MKQEEKKEAATPQKSVFEELNGINVNARTEQKEGLTYLSWVWAWGEVKKLYPDASYEVRHWDGKPYLNDDQLGIMVETSVTINGETITMWLPVMDSKNKAMKLQQYTYKTRYGDKTVDAATMFDVNKAIMRCLAKNIAMFGLGLYIYAGEDLPEDEAKQLKEESKRVKNKDDKTCDEVAELMRRQTTMEAVRIIYKQYPTFAEELAKVGQEMASVLAVKQ